MRVIPVIDLRGGVVVRAGGGDRDRYRPLEDGLGGGSDPSAVAEAMCAASGERTIYVADLDAIAGAPLDSTAIRAVAAVADVWADAGAVSERAARALAEAGAARNVVGTESLTAPRPPSAGPPPVLSVDLRDGRIVSPLPELAGREPSAAAALARRLGARELIVIDLSLVGGRGGPPLQAVSLLAELLPETAIFAGGGVRDEADLTRLERAGAAGALVSTALHDGAIRPSRARTPRRHGR